MDITTKQIANNSPNAIMESKVSGHIVSRFIEALKGYHDQD